MEYVAYNSEGYEAEKILDARYVPVSQTYAILIKWKGLQSLGSSWEPANIIVQDVAVYIKKFCKTSKSAAVMRMAKVDELG